MMSNTNTNAGEENKSQNSNDLLREHPYDTFCRLAIARDSVGFEQFISSMAWPEVFHQDKEWLYRHPVAELVIQEKHEAINFLLNLSWKNASLAAIKARIKITYLALGHDNRAFNLIDDNDKANISPELARAYALNTRYSHIIELILNSDYQSNYKEVRNAVFWGFGYVNDQVQIKKHIGNNHDDLKSLMNGYGVSARIDQIKELLKSHPTLLNSAIFSLAYGGHLNYIFDFDPSCKFPMERMGGALEGGKFRIINHLLLEDPSVDHKAIYIKKIFEYLLPKKLHQTRLREFLVFINDKQTVKAVLEACKYASPNSLKTMDLEIEAQTISELNRLIREYGFNYASACVKLGDIEQLRAFIKSNAPITAPTTSVATQTTKTPEEIIKKPRFIPKNLDSEALLDAIQEDDLEIIDQCIAAGIDKHQLFKTDNHIQPKEMRLTHYALLNGSIKALKHLVEYHGVSMEMLANSPQTNMLYLSLLVDKDERKDFLLWVRDHSHYIKFNSGTTQDHVDAALGNYKKKKKASADSMGLTPHDYAAFSGIDYCNDLENIDIFRTITQGELKNLPLLIVHVFRSEYVNSYSGYDDDFIDMFKRLIGLSPNSINKINIMARYPQHLLYLQNSDDQNNQNSDDNGLILLPYLLLDSGIDLAIFNSILARHKGEDININLIIKDLLEEKQLEIIKELLIRYPKQVVNLTGPLDCENIAVNILNRYFKKGNKIMQTNADNNLWIFKEIWKRNKTQKLNLNSHGDKDKMTLAYILVYLKEFKLLNEIFDANPQEIDLTVIGESSTMIISEEVRKNPLAIVLASKENGIEFLRKAIKFHGKHPIISLDSPCSFKNYEHTSLAWFLAKANAFDIIKFFVEETDQIFALLVTGSKITSEKNETILKMLIEKEQFTLLQSIIHKIQSRINCPTAIVSQINKRILDELKDELTKFIAHSPQMIAGNATGRTILEELQIPYDNRMTTSAKITSLVEEKPIIETAPIEEQKPKTEIDKFILERHQKNDFTVINDPINNNKIKLTMTGKQKLINELTAAFTKANLKIQNKVNIKGNGLMKFEIEGKETAINAIFKSYEAQIAKIFANNTEVQREQQTPAPQTPAPLPSPISLTKEERDEWIQDIKAAFGMCPEIMVEWDDKNCCLEVSIANGNSDDANNNSYLIHIRSATGKSKNPNKIKDVEKFLVTKEYMKQHMFSRLRRALEPSVDNNFLQLNKKTEDTVKITFYKKITAKTRIIHDDVYKNLTDNYTAIPDTTANDSTASQDIDVTNITNTNLDQHTDTNPAVEIKIQTPSINKRELPAFLIDMSFGVIHNQEFNLVDITQIRENKWRLVFNEKLSGWGLIEGGQITAKEFFKALQLSLPECVHISEKNGDVNVIIDFTNTPRPTPSSQKFFEMKTAFTKHCRNNKLTISNNKKIDINNNNSNSSNNNATPKETVTEETKQPKATNKRYLEIANAHAKKLAQHLELGGLSPENYLSAKYDILPTIIGLLDELLKNYTNLNLDLNSKQYSDIYKARAIFADALLYFLRDHAIKKHNINNNFYTSLTSFLILILKLHDNLNAALQCNPFETILLSQHPLFQKFYPIGKKEWDVELFTSCSVRKLLNQIHAGVATLANDTNKIGEKELLMRLTEIGMCARALSKQHSYYCLKAIKINLKISDYRPEIFNKIIEKTNFKIDTNGKAPCLLPYLKQYIILRDEILRELNPAELLILCREIRNDYIHGNTVVDMDLAQDILKHVRRLEPYSKNLALSCQEHQFKLQSIYSSVSNSSASDPNNNNNNNNDNNNNNAPK